MTTHEPDNTRPEPAADRRPQAPALGMGDQLHYQRYQRKNNVVLWSIFALLVALTAGVFFLLPRYVGPPAPAAAVVVPVSNPAAPAAAALSPFEEAQRMRQREAAQNTLQALLELQQELEQKQVQQWAGDQFTAGLDMARSGDEAYRQQQYLDAANRYQQGVDMLQAIRASEGEIFESSMANGNASLLAGDAEAADAAFSQALLLRPDSSEAVNGLERATVLNQVLELLANGRNLQAGNQLEAARELYQQAQQLDAANTEAGALRPGSAEVASALQQAQDQQTFAAISVHLDAAREHESAERWQEALTAWNQALTVDPNLVSALEGQRRSQSRSNLDQFLEATIANPLRLAEDSVYEQTRQVLVDAGRIPDPGPRLLNQLQQVSAFVDRARIPVTVQLQSDGLTSVTIYRVAELGPFTSHTLALVPGEYVAVGVRPGYRDVRQEFVVGLDGQSVQVSVACTESI